MFLALWRVQVLGREYSIASAGLVNGWLLKTKHHEIVCTMLARFGRCLLVSSHVKFMKCESGGLMMFQSGADVILP